LTVLICYKGTLRKKNWYVPNWCFVILQACCGCILSEEKGTLISNKACCNILTNGLTFKVNLVTAAAGQILISR
jgi:hypothetical protein